MERLRLFEEKTVPKKGFWRRQFQKDATRSQRNFDWCFGVVLPVICFTFDPIVFSSSSEFNRAFLGDLKAFAYLLSFVSVMAMSAWLIWGTKLKWLNAFLAGLFLTGGIISFIVGVALFPLSTLGLIVFIGILGYTPLFSSIIFLRNSLRAFQMAKPFFEKCVLVRTLTLTAIFSFIIPLVINFEINRMSETFDKDSVKIIRGHYQVLKSCFHIVNDDPIIAQLNQGHNLDNGEKMQSIAKQCERFTG